MLHVGELRTACRCWAEIQRKHCSIFVLMLYSHAGVLILLPSLRMNEPDGNAIGSCSVSAKLVRASLELRRTHLALAWSPSSTLVDSGLNPSRVRGWQVYDDLNSTQLMSTASIAVLSSLAPTKMKVGGQAEPTEEQRMVIFTPTVCSGSSRQG